MIKMIPFCATYLPYIAIVPATMAWTRSDALTRRTLALRCIAGLGFAALLGVVAGQAYFEMNPDARAAAAPLVFHRPSTGIPLWPMLIAATIGLILMPYWRLAGYFCLAAALVSASANVAARHNTYGEAAATVLIAAAAALIARALVRRGVKKRYLYPKRASQSGSGENSTQRDHDAIVTTDELHANRATATISEFDSRIFIGYSDLSVLRN